MRRKASIVDSFGRLPLSFEANRGQTNPLVRFLSRGSGYTLFLTRRGEAVLALRKPAPKRDLQEQAANVLTTKPFLEPPTPSAVVRMNLVGASTTPQLEGLEELQGKANYFIGNDPKKWRTNVPLFSRVRYRNIYPGVDLAYYGNQRQLEDDFIVAPGANPRSIALNFTGVEKLSLDAQGGLVLGVKEGEVRFGEPRIYQEVDGARREISGSYVLKGTGQVGFQVAVVRKNSIRLPSDRDAGTHLFGFQALGSPKTNLANRKCFSAGLKLCNPDRPCFDSFRTQSAHWILCLT